MQSCTEMMMGQACHLITCGYGVPATSKPDSMVWTPHTPLTRLASGLSQACQKYGFYGCHLPPPMKNQHGPNEESNLNKEKMISQLSWVMWLVWLVWVLTTKRKSFLIVFHVRRSISIPDYFAMFNCFFSDLIFKQFYSLDIYPSDLFRIDPLIVHLYLNDIII